tara:strand:- start:496 stop:2574 length:2079 start_codon:yes stop_codon:yes gene_type:complete
MEFRLGGKQFSTPPGEGITPYIIDVLAQPQREGSITRQDNRKIQRLVFDNWTAWGIGWPRMRRDKGSAISGMRDATALTLHSEGITPGILNNAQTHASPANHIRRYVNFLGDFWGIFEEDYAADAITDIVCRKFGSASDDFTGGGTVSSGGENAVGQRVWDATVHKGRIVVLHNDTIAGSGTTAEDSYSISDSPDGATFTERRGTGFASYSDAGLTTTITRRNNFDDDMGRVLDFGNTLMVALYDLVGDSVIHVSYSVDQGANWTDGAQVFSGDGPKAFVRWRNPFSSPSADSPVLITAEGVYRVDSAGTTFDLIHPLDGNPNNGRWAVVGQDGGLYIGLGDGSLRVLYITSPGVVEVRTSGRGLLPAARQGHINCMIAPSLPWLIVTYGGHAGDKQSSIFAIDYQWQKDPATDRVFQPWHSMYLEADDDIDLYMLGYSTEDDATPRLHFALEHASTAEMYHLEQPFANPLSGVSQQFQSSSYIEWAEDDLADPNADSLLLSAGVDADNLSITDTREHIEHEYGLNGDVSTTVSDFGKYVSGDKQLFFGRTNQNIGSSADAGKSEGISAKTVRHRLILNRGAAGSSSRPLLKEFEVQAKAKQELLIGYRVPVDLEALTSVQRDSEQVISDIESVLTSVTLVEFEYGKSGIKLVEAVPSSALFEHFVDGERMRFSGRRTGTAVLFLEEVKQSL